MKAAFGTDTARLYDPAGNLQFEPNFRADVPNKRDNATGELKYTTVLCHTTDREPVRGMRVEIFEPDFQFTVSADKQGRQSAYLQFSARAYRENNLEPSSLEHVMDTIPTIERVLKERGIHWDLSKSRVSTLAANRNPIMNETPSNYMPVVSALGVRKPVDKTEYGNTGRRLGNSQWDGIFYGKRGEMRAKGYDASVCPENLLRGEIEWSKAAVVLKATGIRTVADIPENWGNIEPAFNRWMDNEIFRPRTDKAANKPLPLDLTGMLSEASEKPRPFSSFAQELGLLALVQSEGLERAKWLIETQLGDATTKAGKVVLNRWNQMLQDASTRLELERVSAAGVQNLDLYRELKSKMIGE